MLQLISHRTKSLLIRYSLCLTLLVVGSLAAAQDIPENGRRAARFQRYLAGYQHG